MKIELLSPAKDYNCGIAAIDYGADAVYIGAPKFGARANASNPIDDIERLISYAHKFNVKIYPVLNTILYEHELDDAQALIHSLYKIGADALIIQDMGILEMDLPPIPLFASTQTHNYEIEKIKFLESIGMQRVILARELSLKKIKEIREQTSIELEFFVHGALCVSFSGQCYFSEAVTGRSANRGECSQPCRMRYNLIDESGKIILKNKNILSLKDLNLSSYISGLIEAGVCSFKIEGRLKDISYVKNITALYRSVIDEALRNKTGFEKSSMGNVNINFLPQADKSFNRSFTDYYLNRSKRNHVASINTEKSIGEPIGKIVSVAKDHITIDSSIKLNNGDGICFFCNDILHGTNVNSSSGNKVYLNRMDDVKPGTIIYRNSDIRFNDFLSKNKLKRKIKINFQLALDSGILILTGTDKNGNSFSAKKCKKEFSENNNSGDYSEKIINQLRKTGETIFEAGKIDISHNINFSIPLSLINQLRREVTSGLEDLRLNSYKRKESVITPNDIPYPLPVIDYRANVVNSKAKEFYLRHKACIREDGFELLSRREGKEIMNTKYCIRYEIGLCPAVDKNIIPHPLYLENNKQRYRIEFDCKECEMKIIPE